MVDPTRQAISVTARGEEEAGEQGPTLSPTLSPTRRLHLLNLAGPKGVLDKAAVSGELAGPERRSRETKQDRGETGGV